MAELYSKSVAGTVFALDQNPQEATGENPRKVFDAISHWAGLGRMQQELSATSAERMIAFPEMIMGNVPHLGNSAANAEDKTTSKERLHAKEDSSRGEEGETRVEQELAELFKYAVYQVQRRRPWQRSMSKH